MRILSHYYATRFLGLFVMVLAAALLVLATLELVLNLDDIAGWGGSESAASPGGFASLVAGGGFLLGIGGIKCCNNCIR